MSRKDVIYTLSVDREVCLLGQHRLPRHTYPMSRVGSYMEPRTDALAGPFSQHSVTRSLSPRPAVTKEVDPFPSNMLFLLSGTGPMFSA